MHIDFSVVSQNLARIYGDAECVVNVERNRRYSFVEYHRLTNRIINMMRERLGLGRGDVWMTILHNDNLSLLGFFTAFKGEACACYTNTTDSLEIQENQIQLVRPGTAFIEAELLPTHYQLLKKYGITIVSMDPPAPEYADVLHFWDLLEGVSEENPHVVSDDRNDCLLLRFTGGTTGAPKAVMYSIDNWMANRDLHFASADPVPSRSERLLHFGMISHASGIAFFPILFKGGCTLTMNDRSVATFCRTVERERVTSSVMVPSMLYRMLDDPEVGKHDLSSLQTMYYGASPMSPTRLKQLHQRFGNIFVQLYGSSEHPGAVSTLSKAEHLPDLSGSEAHLASAGRVVPGAEVLIVDKNGQPVADGEDGEIWMRSRAVCMGYLHNPEKSALEFCDGFWKSGDMGRIDANGFLYVLDRARDTIVHKNCNVYPNQVEAALMAHDSVVMAAVVGIPDPECGEWVHAEVVLRGDADTVAEDLRHFLEQRLAPHNIPRTINFAPALPLSPVGKVLRRVVRETSRQTFETS
jgi:acyl-CoA synthetase (AMP-forming)/AMP-acid ligase II